MGIRTNKRLPGMQSLVDRGKFETYKLYRNLGKKNIER